MQPQRLVRVMQCQYKAALAADHPNLYPLMDEAGLKDWHFLVCNLPAPYAEGEYIFRLRAGDQFPQKPPEFTFLTPNGVFEPGGKICISIGEFHASAPAGKEGSYGWRPALGMAGFAREVVNGMIDPDYLEGGIRVLNDPPATRALYASQSAAYNQKHHANLVAQFRGFESGFPDNKAVRGRRMWSAAAAAGANLEVLPVADLSALLAGAFGPLWALMAESFAAATKAPDGRALLRRVAAEMRDALAERDTALRRALVLALNVRFCLEAGARPERAFADFMEVLPGVCGGACSRVVPEVVRDVGRVPGAFPPLHAGLSAFLRTVNIDEKASRGRAFASRAAAQVAATLAEEQAGAAAAPAPPEEKERPAPGSPKGPALGLSDDDIVSLLEGLGPL